ncbi:MAG: PH domain-containing protein [Bdellovibrionales bacterium]
MSYIDKIMLPGEQVICAACLHWIVYFNGLFITVIGGILGHWSYPLMTFCFGPEVGKMLGRPVAGGAMLLVLVGAALLVGAYIRQSSTEIAITTRRLIVKVGFISRSTYEILTPRITGANFDQTIMGRVLGFGTIWVHGAGGEVSPIASVGKPQRFYKALIDTIGKSR